MALDAFRRTLIRFDASKITTEIAFRNTAGFTAAFLLGNVFGGTNAAVLAGLGALNVAYSDSRDPYAIRARRMLISSVLSGIAVTLGALSGHNSAVAVTAATLWAFGSGMLVSLGATAGDLGVITLVTLVVFAARPLPIYEAAESGMLALTGGLLQTLLAIALWPVQRYEPERRIVAGLYESLAAMARTPSLPSQAPPVSMQISDAQDQLGNLYRDHTPESERLVFLVNQAERMRLSVITLGRLERRLHRHHAQGEAVAAEIARVLTAAAEMLEDIGRCTLAGKQAPRIGELRISAHFYAAGRQTPFFAALLEDARRQTDALGGQIRSAAGASVPTWSVASFHPSMMTLAGRNRERLAKLRANLSIDSTVLRHAVRLAICLGISDAVGRMLSLERTYWIPMTVAIVLKPDFTATVSRGILRILGTFAGLLLATALFHFVHTGVATDIALMTLFTFLLRWVGSANYGIFVTALSSMVVLLIATTGVPPKDVIAARAVNTSLGGLIAMIAYFVWPTWEKANVGAALGDMLDAYRIYYRAVMDAYAGGSTEAIDAVRVSGRRARSNAEASVDRLGSEPGAGEVRMKALNGVLVSSHSFVHAVMSLESGLYRTEGLTASKEVVIFAADVDTTLAACAVSLREGSLPKPLPDLREACNRLLESKVPANARYGLMNIEADRIVTTLNSLSE